MSSYVFDRLITQGVRAGQIPARTQEARNWYRDKAGEISRNSARPQRFLQDSNRMKSKVEPGMMYMFFYDAKTKDDLPYWDKFPLIFMIESADGGFTGLNLHYLPLRLRARLMDALYSLTSNQRYDDRTRLQLSYSILKGAARFSLFKPCFKRYLNSNVRSRFVYVHPSEWDIALFLPTERFQKARKQTVHADSARMV
jgi:hypothetical protein